jgi:hypothetical protein
MLTGIKNHFNPTSELSEILSQWIGCARMVYNAKCDEDRYLRTYAQKYLPIDFHCLFCHHEDNADHNVAVVIKQRTITLILHSGTELVEIHKNVLRLGTNTPCKRKSEKNKRKTGADNSGFATDCLSKKTTELALSEARTPPSSTLK